MSTKMRMLALAALTLFASPAIHAQDIWQVADSWQGRLDLTTAGAAASVVMYHYCMGEQASTQAGEYAVLRLRSFVAQIIVTHGADPRAATDYAQDTYDRKIKAMWSANQGLNCSQLGRLRDLAQGTGYLTPY